MKLRKAVILMAGAALVLCSPPSSSAQGFAFRAGGGATIPVGGAGRRYGAGPAATVSLEKQLTRVFGLRLDAEWSRVSGGQISFYPEDMRTYGLSLNGVIRFPDAAFAPYVLAGIGGYRLQRIGGDPSPYGTTAALQAGLGIDTNVWDRIRPFAEVRAVAHITDYASDEWMPSVFWPIVVGVRVPLRTDG